MSHTTSRRTPKNTLITHQLAAGAAALLALLAAATPAVASPDEPGSVLETRRFEAAWLPDHTASATWVRYATTDALVRPAESTAFVLLPTGDFPEGGWPVIAWAHGTQGTADDCAPTVSGPYDSQRDAAYLDHWLDEGYAVVASDYAGLGSDGDHAYLHGPSVAHNIVDAVTAAHQLPAIPDGALSERWAVVGHSQGAGAALATASVASDLDGPLDFRGMVGTGTPVRVADDIVALGPGSPGEVAPPTVTAYVAYLLDGIRQTAPELDSVLSDEGRDVLARSRTLCLRDLASSLADTVIGDMFVAPVSGVPELEHAVRAYLDIPERGYDRPLFLGHGTADVDVRYERTARFAADLVAAGEPITFRSYEGVTHSQTIAAAQADATSFLADLFDGAGR